MSVEKLENMSMIEVNGLVRRYGNFTAVDDVSFSIKSGEIVGLLGHNGAGKSTVMKMLSGHLEASEGRIMIDNEDIAQHRRSVQSKIGYLPESLPLYSEMSVIDYLHYVSRLRSLHGDAAINDIRDVVEATDLHEKLANVIHTLSRGFKQRVAVAGAILGNPKILILDEPTNGLDPTQTQHMRDLIKKLSQHTTVIISTHIMQEVDAICHRTLIMTQGKLALDSNLSELQQSNKIIVHTSMPDSQAKVLIQSIPQVHSIERLSQPKETMNYQYCVTLKDKNQVQMACEKLAKSIISGGFAIYQLSPQKQDLEMIFRQVNSQNSHNQEEVKDVA